MNNSVSTINAFNNPQTHEKIVAFKPPLFLTTFFGFLFKTIFWIGFLGGFMLLLQLASLEICSRLGVFPLYGFALTTLLYSVFLVSLYRVAGLEIELPNINPFAGISNFNERVKVGISLPKFARNEKDPKQIPVVLLIIKHRKTEQPIEKESVK